MHGSEPTRGVAGDGPQAAEIGAQLQRLLASRAFARTPRLRRLLTYLVQEKLAGRGAGLKEYVLGREVFDRGDAFDPRADPIVRIDARRLRARLDQYYRTEGSADRLAIDIPRGAYVPIFRRRTAAPRRHSFNRRVEELFVRARYLLEMPKPEATQRAVRFLREAVVMEPGFAAAHALLAMAHLREATFVLRPPIEALRAAELHARTAAAADPELAAGHGKLALVKVMLDHDFAAAEESFQRARAIGPDDADLRHDRLLWLLIPMRRFDEAHSELDALIDGDPLSVTLRLSYARLLLYRGDYDHSASQLTMLLDMAPDFGAAWFYFAVVLERLGQHEAARAAHVRHVDLLDYPLTREWLAIMRACWAGNAGEARALTAAMERAELATGASVLADAHLRLGNDDSALTWLRRGLEARISSLIYLNVDPRFEHLAGHARFRELLGRFRPELPARSGPRCA